MTVRRRVTAAALAAILTAAPAQAGSTGLEVRQVLSPEAPPGASVHAAYLVLENTGAAPRRLVGVQAEGYARAEIHETRMVDGVMSMAPIAELSIPAGGTVAFEPGGLHVMLMGPDGARAQGDTVPLALIFADGTRIEAGAEVVARGALTGDDGASHGHGS